MVTKQPAEGVARNAVNLLFPPRCILCDAWPDEEAARLCANCARKLDDERGIPSCPWCAASVAPYEVWRGRCRACRNRRLRVAGTVRVGPYSVPDTTDTAGPDASVRSGPASGGGSTVEGGRLVQSHLGQLVRSFKYHEREQVGLVLGEWLAEVVAKAPWYEKVEAIVSVPTHWTRRVWYPLHAADALASIVAGRTGLSWLPILKRVRAGPHQIGLSYDERVRNVRDAFALRRGVRLRDARLLLIDDVKTTGATINECAKMLRQGGAAEVYAAVVGTAGWDQSTGQVPPPI